MFNGSQNDNSYLDYNNYDNDFSMSFSKDFNDNNLYLNEDFYEGGSFQVLPVPKLYEEISTFMKTNSKNYINSTIKESEIEFPNFNSISFIIDCLSEFINDEDIKKKLLEGIIIQNTGEYEFIELTRKKRKREKEKETEIGKINISKKIEINISNTKDVKRGRKKKNKNILNKTHDKMCADNIIKKIKSKLFKIILNFLNKVLNVDNQNKLVKLDYSLINEIKRESELNLLDKPLKEIFSLNISTKYKAKSAKYNKLIIDKIINNELPLNSDYQTKVFVLNITYGDFIECFTHKKNIEDLNNSFKNINYENIKANFPFVESLLYELCNKNDSKYVCLFLFYLFNFKRYLLLKQVRERKDKK